MKDRLQILKRIIAFVLALVFVVGVINLETTNVDASTKKKVSISRTSLKLGVNIEYKLSVKGTSKKPVWKSSNKKVARVYSTGVVKTLKPGKTIISAKVGGKTYKCEVRVFSGDFKHTHRYKEKIDIHETYLVLDPPIVANQGFVSIGEHFGEEKGNCRGLVYLGGDIPSSYINYGSAGGLIYSGIFCTGQMIDKTHFKRDTLRNNDSNVGDVSLVTGKNSRIIDLKKLEWYCIHYRTSSYFECVYCGGTTRYYYAHNAYLSYTNEKEKKYYSPNCTCDKFRKKQYGRTFMCPIKSVEQEGTLTKTIFGDPKVKFSRCKHENELEFFYKTYDSEDHTSFDTPSSNDMYNRYKCPDCGAILCKADLKIKIKK